MSSRTYTLVLLAWILHLTNGLDKDSTFMDSLLNHANYDKRLRPYYRVAPVNVTVGLTIASFGGVSEVESEFTLDLFFRQLWEDPRLRHNSSRPHSLTGQDKSLVWLPDTYFLNIKKAHLHGIPSDNSNVLIRSGGKVQYSTRITLSASCEMELSSYPLDTQTCDLRIMSYANSIKEVKYSWVGPAGGGLSVLSANMAQFEVTKINGLDQETVLARGAEAYSELVVRFEFKRRIGYSLLQVYAPTILIVVLSWFSFWISKDAIPARVALGVTTVLTIVTLNGSLRSSVPKVSYIKALDLYLIVSFLFVFGAVLEYVTVLMHFDYHDYARSHSNTDDVTKDSGQRHDVPDHHGKSEGEHIVREEVTSTTEQTTTRETKLSLRQPGREGALFKFKHKLDTILSVNSTPIDKASKVLFPATYFVFNAVYWLVYCL